MRLYLVQHGEAMSKDENPERPLTAKGRENTTKTAKFLKKKGIRVRKIFHSTKLRAKQTAQIIASLLGCELQEEKDLEPLADPSIWAKKIRSMNEDIMIVGHLPHLGALASLLLCGESKEILRFYMGGVVCLEKEENWKLLFSIPPEFMDE